MLRLSPLVNRWLQPFASGLWVVFVLWSIFVAAVWAGGFGESEASAWVARRFPSPESGVVGYETPLGSALGWLLASLDPVWIALAAVNTYVSLVASEGLARARRWSVVVLLVVMLVTSLAVAKGGVAGVTRFTSRLGPLLAGVPFGWPLLWCVVLFGGREAMRRVWRRGTHGQVALATGALAALTAWNLAPVAAQQRVWWLAAAAAAWQWPAGVGRGRGRAGVVLSQRRLGDSAGRMARGGGAVDPARALPRGAAGGGDSQLSGAGGVLRCAGP